MIDWEDRRYLVTVANLYHNDNWTQEKIAKKFSVSRPVISKALQRAKQLGIIKVYINDKTLHSVNLERRLEDKFNLTEAIVVPNKNESAELKMNSVAKVAANYLSKNIQDINSIGISWGRTLTAFTQEYPYELKEDINIVPLEGGMGRKQVEIHANQLAYELANKMGGTCSYLYAPAIVESKELYERLIGMEDINALLTEARNVDMAVISLGNPYNDSTLESVGYIQQADNDKLQESGVAGDIGFRFFDENGQVVENPLDKKLIGISLNDLKKIETVIAVVSGTNKADTLHAALKGNFIDILIVDQETATLIDKKH